MKILLVGEYSRLHNSLKEGLTMLGHSVTIVGTQDGFKNYPVDLPLHKRYNKGLHQKFKNLIYRLFKYDLESYHIKKQIISYQPKLSGFDIVQFINEAPFGCTAKIEQEIFDAIRSWNTAIFLLSCGTDYISVNYAYHGHLKYSILTPYFQNKTKRSDHSYGLKFLKPEFKTLHDHIYTHITGVIASDIDYHIPLQQHPKYLGLVPNPVNTDRLKFTPLEIRDKIIIFHGINHTNYFKKGNDLFELALKKLDASHKDKVQIITVQSLPYEQYINAYNSAHIVLDMIYAFDQGYNALEAMAKGKVVFTGAEEEWLSYYNLDADTVAINAEPDVSALVRKLEWLIENPNKLKEISSQARAFIETRHHYIRCAEAYLEKWTAH
jgi:hypothetical protein